MLLGRLAGFLEPGLGGLVLPAALAQNLVAGGSEFPTTLLDRVALGDVGVAGLEVGGGGFGELGGEGRAGRAVRPAAAWASASATWCSRSNRSTSGR